MANKRISQLPFGTLNPNTIFPVVSNGVTSQINYNDLKSDLGNSGAILWVSGTGINSIVQNNTNSIAGFRAFDGETLYTSITINSLTDLTSFFTSNQLIVDTTNLLTYSSTSYNSPVFTINLVDTYGPQPSNIIEITYIPMTNTGLDLIFDGGSGDDDDVFEIGLPIDFNLDFFGTDFSNVFINTNGITSFGTGTNDCCFDLPQDISGLGINNGIFLSIDNSDGSLCRLYSGLTNGGDNLVIRVEGRYLNVGAEDCDNNDLTYNYIFYKNDTTRVDIIIDSNPFPSTDNPISGLNIDGSNTYYETFNGVSNTAFSIYTTTEPPVIPTNITVVDTNDLNNPLATNVIGDNSFIVGDNSKALNNNVNILGSNITGNTENTTYVSKLNVGTVLEGVPINNLGVDENGNVIVGLGDTPYVIGWQKERQLGNVISIGYGKGKLLMTNGSNVIIGTNGVDFNNDSNLDSPFYNEKATIILPDGTIRYVELNNHTGSTIADIYSVYSDNRSENNLGPLWDQPTGEYNYYPCFIGSTSNDLSYAEGNSSQANGIVSHAEGNYTQANGNNSHAEGLLTLAQGNNSHAEGEQTTASGQWSHAEGRGTIASDNACHAEGNFTQAIGNQSHAEGWASIASGEYSHAQGQSTQAQGNSSHSEGAGTIAFGQASHAEGLNSKANGDYSHAGGVNTTASGLTSFVHGDNSRVNGNYSVVLGRNITGSTADTTYVDKFNIKTLSSGTSINNLGIDASGNVVTGGAGSSGGHYVSGWEIERQQGNTINVGYGKGKILLTNGSNMFTGTNGVDFTDDTNLDSPSYYYEMTIVLPNNTKKYIFIDDFTGATIGKIDTIYSNNQGINSEGNIWTGTTGEYNYYSYFTPVTTGQISYAEGRQNLASGDYSHAEGKNSIATGDTSHAEGQDARAWGTFSHAEGQATTAKGLASHSEGGNTFASGDYSHAGGQFTTASGGFSFVHGSSSTASGNNSIVLGANITGTGSNRTYVADLVHKKIMGVPVNSASALGELGSITWDNTYFYWKTTTQWLRISGSTF